MVTRVYTGTCNFNGVTNSIYVAYNIVNQWLMLFPVSTGLTIGGGIVFDEDMRYPRWNVCSFPDVASDVEAGVQFKSQPKTVPPCLDGLVINTCSFRNSVETYAEISGIIEQLLGSPNGEDFATIDVSTLTCSAPISAPTRRPIVEETPDAEETPAQDSDQFYSPKYTTNRIYNEGQGGYHDHHGSTPNRPLARYKGYPYLFGIELEVECRGSSNREKVISSESNWFYHERDGSLGDYGDEIITIPLLPEDAKDTNFWAPLVSWLRTKAESWTKSSTGLHVHISRSILGDNEEERSETTGKLLYFYHHCIGEDSRARAVNEKVYGRAHTYNECDGKTETGKAARCLGQSVFKEVDIKDKVKDDLLSKNEASRYFDINLRNEDTIEFRKGKGSIDTRRIVAICEWSERMVLYCKSQSWENLSFRNFIEGLNSNPDVTAALKFFIS